MRRVSNLPALLAPHAAALLTAAIAGDAPWFAALALFALLAFAALMVLSAITGGKRDNAAGRAIMGISMMTG